MCDHLSDLCLFSPQPWNQVCRGSFRSCQQQYLWSRRGIQLQGGRWASPARDRHRAGQSALGAVTSWSPILQCPVNYPPGQDLWDPQVEWAQGRRFISTCTQHAFNIPKRKTWKKIGRSQAHNSNVNWFHKCYSHETNKTQPDPKALLLMTLSPGVARTYLTVTTVLFSDSENDHFWYSTLY